MAPEPRCVVLVVYDGFQLLDLAGPADVFDAATRGLLGQEDTARAGASAAERGPGTAGPAAAVGAASAAAQPGPAVAATPGAPAPGYELVVATPSGRPARAGGGLRVSADAALAAIDPATVDTLVVSGGLELTQPLTDRRLVGEIARLAGGARRTCSVCSGALLLAAAGLLDGRRATTHWAACELLAALHPDVTVEPDRIFVRDGSVLTSAGVTAGMDLALALVEDDHGPELARRTARWLVLFAQRPGGQSQFSERLALPLGAGSPIRALLDEIVADPAADHRVPALAARAAVSERHLARLFAEHARTTPGRFVERVRVEAARDLLERTRTPVDAVARRCGFGSPETMRRAFLRILGVGPRDYRARFQRTPEPRGGGRAGMTGRSAPSVGPDRPVLLPASTAGAA
jgi:transcriptional regulator GlxA family with amidase domain